MKKHKGNVFAQKFRLLSSQESQVINWSASESSDDYENTSSNVDKVCKLDKKKSCKRKRKQRVPKNISNLDVTIIDLTKDNIKENQRGSALKTDAYNEGTKSPILGSTQYFSPYKCKDGPTSPIITCKTVEYQSKTNKSSKSPILVLKTASPKISPNVGKKLFKHDSKSFVKRSIESISNSNSLILNENNCLDRRKCPKIEPVDLIHMDNNDPLRKTSRENIGNQHGCLTGNTKTKDTIKSIVLSQNATISTSLRKSISERAIKDIKLEMASLEEQDDIKMEILTSSQKTNTDEVCIITETPELNLDDSMAMLKTPSLDLAKKVKNYFDNQFSSEITSQQTISQISTPKNNSKTSDDVEIISTMTQALTNKNSIESKEVDTLETDKKEKKMRYKKGGLAYRLNTLLKKQTASTSLWQHERFLAENSNFVIPKGEFQAFRICKINSKYGCILLEAMDLNDDNYLILIKNGHSCDNILEDSIIKLYEPFTKLDFNQCHKLVINVTKFECVNIKN